MALAPKECPATLDVRVLQGLETYIQTEKFLHTLEECSAEWIDLSDHQQHPHKGWSPPASTASGVELQQWHQPRPEQPEQQAPTTATDAPAEPASSKAISGGFFSRWRKSSGGCTVVTQAAVKDAAQPAAADSAGPGGDVAATATSGAAGGAGSSSGVGSSSEFMPAIVAATTTFELVEPQAPLAESLLQEPFVLVSSEDAIEGMAYYIALYLSRAPEARYMEPKQLQAALRQTMTAIRRSRYRVIWDWGRSLYRWGAVSYSMLQLYEHPWLVRAVVAGVWASSKMALGVLF